MYDLDLLNSTTNTEEVLLMYESLSCNIAWCTLAFSILGVLTNAVSIYIYTHRTIRSPVNVLLAGLSAIDLCLSAFFIPAFVIPAWSECFETGVISQSLMVYCTFYFYPVTMMAQSASVFTFLVIGFERWIAVCYPLKARWSTIRGSYRALVAVCIAAICYNAVRFFEHEVIYIDGVPTLNHLLKNHTAYPTYMPVYYVTMYLITHFIAPFVILISLNILMILSIVKARRQRLMLGRKQKSEHKTTFMMGVVVVVFVMCNTLPFVLNFIEAVDHSFFKNDNTLLLGWALLDISNLLVVVNTSTTAFIYYACSQRYRRFLLLTLCRICCGLRCLPFKLYVNLHSNLSSLDKGYSLALQSTITTNVTLTSTLSSSIGLKRSLILDDKSPISICSTRKPKDVQSGQNIARIVTAVQSDNGS